MRDFYSVLVVIVFGGMMAGVAAQAEDNASRRAKTVSEKFYQISVSDAEQAVAEALKDKGAGEDIAVHAIGRHSALLYESDKALSIQVKTLDFDETSHRWSANILFMHNDTVLSATPLSGRFEELVEVPVLKMSMRSGQLVGDEDIGWMKFPQLRLRKGTVLKAEEVVGKSVRRTISPNRPIREDELAAPAVVKKNAMVRMSYQTGGLSVETSGIAMEEGAMGDIIRVQNVDSKMVVRAEVESETRVRVMDIGRTPGGER